MEKKWVLTILISKSIFLGILFILAPGYQYFILFSEKLVQYLNLNDKRIL
jgi:hypothetical protein